METPYLEVDLAKLEHNARQMARLCAAHGVEPAFVTKGFCARPDIIRAVMAGGIGQFADSRIKNIKRVKQAVPGIRYLLIRIPMLSEADEVVAWADWSVQSQIEVIRGVSQAALRQGKIHKIILMMDVGDLRKGSSARKSCGPWRRRSKSAGAWSWWAWAPTWAATAASCRRWRTRRCCCTTGTS